jgi:hypothetical protein
MTSKRDPKGRDWGPPLAIAGAVVVIGAVIAGFIAVGGPGDARAKRLDNMTMERIASSVQLAQCAFMTNGQAPETIAEALTVPAQNSVAPGDRCGDFQTDRALRDVRAGQPEKPGDVTYNIVNANRVRLCGFFRTSFSRTEARFSPSAWISWPELEQDRPAGQFCYELELKSDMPAGAK